MKKEINHILEGDSPMVQHCVVFASEYKMKINKIPHCRNCFKNVENGNIDTPNTAYVTTNFPGLAQALQMKVEGLN